MTRFGDTGNVPDGDDTAVPEPSPELLRPLRARIPSGWWPHIEAPRGWWKVLHQLDADLAVIDPQYELRRVARVDNGLLYLTSTSCREPVFARRIGRAMYVVRAVCEVCGRRGKPRTRSRTVLCELHWHPTSAAERAFALSAGIPEAWFSEEAEIANLAYVAACEAADRKDAAAHLTERDVAGVLDVTVQRVREMFEQGLLAGANHNGRVVYPRWQVTPDGRLLPHLPAVLEAADDIDARSLQAIMENPDEVLAGVSPGQWLAQGRSVWPVLQSLSEWWWI